MRRLLVFTVAVVLGIGATLLLAQTPAKVPAPPSRIEIKQAPPVAALPGRVTTPPIPTPGFAAPRPVDQTRAVYEFAAQHPEVLKYVPCYCGCEADGHPHNESCFVKARDARGNVTQWDTHGYG
jgi:hypothetical protein